MRTGQTRCEFLSSKYIVNACVFLIENKNFQDIYLTDQNEIRNTHINIGTGKDVSIEELAKARWNYAEINLCLIN